MLTLTDVEPGVNFKLGNFHKKVDDSHIEVHGWDLPLAWLTGICLIGIIVLIVTSCIHREKCSD